jgi:tellurite resistance protein TehA-like permease
VPPRRKRDPSRHHAPDGGVSAWLLALAAGLYPGCFALVMATGIISNAFYFLGRHGWSEGLLVVCLLAYPWLLALTVLRLARFGRALWADLVDPRQVFSFFTIVAATDVLGVGISLRGFETLAIAMWFFALGLWFVLIYFSFAVLAFVNPAEGVNVVHGGWLIAIVGTESLVILGTVVAPALGQFQPAAFVLLHLLWGVGLGLYGIFVTLFAYRIFFFEVAPGDITPLLWVVMGAAAIATNAGSALIVTASGVPFLDSMRPFIDGVTLLMWAWATWWIPLLVLFGIWKHGVCRVPLTYSPMLWSLVFPLGMYALASLRVSLTADFPPLGALAQAMAWVALATWLATGAGLIVTSWRSFRDFRSVRNMAG